MEDFLNTLDLYRYNKNEKSQVLFLTNTYDFLTRKLTYLDKLKQDDESILAGVEIIEYALNEAVSLEWLKYFPNLIELNCVFNHLTSSSLESLKYVPKLQKLSINNNKIDNLSNLKYVPNLYELVCFNNQITILSDSRLNLPNLKVLRCSSNKLVSIDISGCESLIYLDCSCNKITEIIYSNVFNIQNLHCSYNEFDNLDVSQCKVLKVLRCNYNKLTMLDLKGLIKLQELYCSFNQLNTLNIKECKDLKILCCNKNKLTKLDLQELIHLRLIYCEFNQLTEIIGLSKVQNLVELYCSNNQLTLLELPNCLYLKRLNCIDNDISNILDILNICKRLQLDVFIYDNCSIYIDYKGLEKCCICFDMSVLSLDKKIIIYCCKHIFHKECLATWIDKFAATCPYCRTKIFEPSLR